MRRVLWIRHGTCRDGLRRPATHPRLASPLTELGAQECRTGATRLRGHEDITLIVSSPLPRAYQSAIVAAGILGVPVLEPRPALAEWRPPDSVLGLAAQEYPPEYRRWRDLRHRDVSSALPGGESLQMFACRASEAMRMVSGIARNGNPLVVSHRLLIGAVAALTAGHDDPSSIFAFACAFRLAPAELWRPPTSSMVTSVLGRPDGAAHRPVTGCP